MEPTANDVNAVAQHLGDSTPAPQPTQQPVQQPTPQVEQPTYTPGISNAPAQQQPAQPTHQPAPTQQPSEPVDTNGQPQDPFAQMFQPAPQEPSQPVQPTEPTPQPQQPVEPQSATPTGQPASQPTLPTQQEEEQYQSFEDYMNSITQGITTDTQVPDPNTIDPTDEEGIKNFFDELVNTAVQRASQETARTQAIQNSERGLWDAAFNKYGSLRTNTKLRDMVHSIRMANFNKGIAITPIQAAEELLSAMNQQYRQGIADNQVQTTIESVQPNGGGGNPVQTTTDMRNVYEAVQVGGEEALASYLDSQIKSGKL